uniref:Uncharacterized protein n=1 Tax=Aegilops tauschii subsp. strangulata TaxID=200361 RepID=A0A453K7H1_AEGTS
MALHLRKEELNGYEEYMFTFLELRLRQGTRLVTSAKETMLRGGTARLADV